MNLKNCSKRFLLFEDCTFGWHQIIDVKIKYFDLTDLSDKENQKFHFLFTKYQLFKISFDELCEKMNEK